MKTVMIRNGEILVEDRPAPIPGAGQVLVKSLACGICGSDLHMFKHADELFELGPSLRRSPARQMSCLVTSSAARSARSDREQDKFSKREVVFVRFRFS